MRILIVGINFAPELVGIGKYTAEMVDWLAGQGHDVRVVTAPPYYPKWQVWDGYSGRHYKLENNNGVRVYRCPLWVPEMVSGLKRILHLLSFGVSSAPVLLSLISWRPKIVFAVAPAIFTAPMSLTAARLSGAKAWLHMQDFEIDAAFDLGLLENNPFKKIIVGLERLLLQKFDRVSTISDRMLSRLLQKGVSRDKTLLFPNWVDSEAIYPVKGSNPIRRELGVPENKVVALYSGNMGQKQGIEILIDVANLLKTSNIQFVLCGEGAVVNKIRDLATGLTNVIFLPLQPSEKLNDLLNLADIHRLPQRAEAADLVMPSKLTGIFASGRPVVAMAHPETEIGKIVWSRGILVPPGNAAAFANAIIQLAENPEERDRLGKAAREFASPLGFKESLFLWKDASLVMTDSGGLQEEITALGIPCFTIRNNTERPITVTEGTNILVGTTKEGIVSAFERFKNGFRKEGKIPELWDGKAAERIVDKLISL